MIIPNKGYGDILSMKIRGGGGDLSGQKVRLRYEE